MISSILWVQTMMESDIEQYKRKDANSWLHLRFQTITNLDANFLEAYLYGGQYLSIIKDDTIGAKEIYEKGLQKFPNNFDLNLNAGFNYFFELGDCKNAYEKYKTILNNPIVKKKYPLLPSLIARIKGCSSGNIYSAKELLEIAYNQAPANSNLKKTIANSLYSINAELDLRCLNSNATNCTTRDFGGNPYIKNMAGEYVAQKSWRPYKINLGRKEID